jgi:hypothetical protein
VGEAARSLGDVLVELGVVEERELRRLLRETTPDRSLGKVVVDRGLLTEDRLLAILSKHLDLDTIRLDQTPIHDRVLGIVPKEIAQRFRVIPIARRKVDDVESLFVATADPFDKRAEAELGKLAPSAKIELVLAGEEDIARALAQHYGIQVPAAEARREVRVGGSAAAIERMDSNAPTRAASSPPVPTPIMKDPLPVADTALVNAEERVGRFGLLERIGVDAVAEVFLTDQTTPDGRQLDLRRPLGTLAKNERTRARFFGDAEKCVGLRHLNLVEVHEVGLRGEVWYVAAEHVGGTDLARLLARARKAKVRLPERAGVHIVAKVVEALDYARTTRGPGGQPLGLLHRGLAPSFVSVSPMGQAKVFGFGLEDGALKGRSPYAAPEQLGEGKIDDRTIVFRAGLMLYELVTGVPLFEEGTHTADDMERVVAGLGRSLRQHSPEAGPELEKVLTKALAVRGPARWTLSELADQLAGLDAKNDAHRSEAELARFADAVKDGAVEETKELPQLREDGVSAKLEEAGKAFVEKAAPLGRKGGESLGRWLEGFGAWFDRAPLSQKLAATLIPIAIVVGTMIGVAIDTPPPELAIEIDTGDGDVAAMDPPPVAPPEATEPQAPVVEILPGIPDVPAPKGMSYVASDGVELSATAEEDAEALLWLEAGHLVEHIRPIDDRMLVLASPKGPAGFVLTRHLTREKPLLALGKQIGFPACKVDAKRTLDDCLVFGKDHLEKCMARCREHAPSIDHAAPPGSRCAQACGAAFEICGRQCNETKASYDEKKTRRRR